MGEEENQNHQQNNPDLSSGDLIEEPPDDSMVPWTVQQAYEHICGIQAQSMETPDALLGDAEGATEHERLSEAVGNVLNIVKIIVENTACPHGDCPHMSLEHGETGTSGS